MKGIYWGMLLVLAGCGLGENERTIVYSNDECGPNRQVQQVYYGTEQPTHVPLSQGQVMAIGSFNGCSGTLIKSDWVLTATHCNISPGRFFCSGFDQANPDVCAAVTEVHNYPGRDVTLARLDQQMTALLPVSPIPPVTQHMKSSWLGQYAELAGYGLQEDGDAGELLFSREPIVALTDDYITVDGQGSRGACFGDSGGPLLVVGELGPSVAGALSNGDADCLGFDNYARVDDDAVGEWIQVYVGPFDGQTDCGAFTDEGRCFPDAEGSGSREAYCSGGSLVTTVCGIGSSCGWDVNAEGYRCITEPDPCEGIDSFGSCSGTVASWCQFGELKTRDCACKNQVCAEDGTMGGAFCVEDPCEGLNYQGECQGDTVRWCDNGKVLERDCAASGQMCGFVDDNVGYYCQAN